MYTQAQFAPQVGVSGTDAIHKSSSRILAWGNHCIVQRGFVNIADKSLGTTSTGDANSAIGIADGNVVSLGDSGVATLSFGGKIYNGDGVDFVVFENGFQNPANKEEAFLELAFVEVSSDGENYYRFPATSNTLSMVQIAGAGVYMNARYINNLAGKYVAQYGTPFDLEELKGIPGLDINNVSHVRILDVVGAINQWGTKDQYNQKINDPYPTPYATGGFDLDAVGVINTKSSSIKSIPIPSLSVYPNPASDVLFIDFGSTRLSDQKISIKDIFGKTILNVGYKPFQQIDISQYLTGLYFLFLENENNTQCIGRFSKI